MMFHVLLSHSTEISQCAILVLIRQYVFLQNKCENEVCTKGRLTNNISYARNIARESLDRIKWHSTAMLAALSNLCLEQTVILHIADIRYNTSRAERSTSFNMRTKQ